MAYHQGQDPNYPILNQIYNPLAYGNWPSYPYYYYSAQIRHSFYSEQIGDNYCIEIKKE